MKILLLAGEESGVLYARDIAAKLRVADPAVEIRGYGDYGFETADLAVMGFVAVLKKIFYFLRVSRTMKRAIDEWKPDAVCTVDYPGLNLKLAAYAKSRGIRAVHVVCPQVWAWKAGRIPKIEAALDRLCCFFPFEPALFKPGFATFVGHPLAEAFAGEEGRGGGRGREGGDKIVALLPGSRLGEIGRNLPTMLEALARLEGVRAVIPAANDRAYEAISRLLATQTPPNPNTPTPSVAVTHGGARELLREADCAVVASGTATLEAALARCPTILVYRVSAFLYWFGRMVIKGIRHIGLANIIAEKTDLEPPMPELIQGDFTAEAVVNGLKPWLTDSAAHAAAARRLDTVVRKLGTGEGAMDNIAREVLAGK